MFGFGKKKKFGSERVLKRLDTSIVRLHQELSYSGVVREVFVQKVLDDFDTEGLDSETREENAKRVIDEFEKEMMDETEMQIGHPVNLDFNYEPVYKLSATHINNIGEPFVESSYGLDSRHFEVGVLQWFAKLWGIKNEDFWGYVTGGGTEGNMHGIYLGREALPDGILYCNEESHYSLKKVARLYRITLEEIPVGDTWEMDYDKLKAALVKNKDFPAIINVTVGTTFMGAVDNVDKVLNALKGAGYTEDRFYIHVDGALSGMLLPFIEGDDVPRITFEKPIGSVAISGHKFLGCPFPCGVLITRLKYTTAVATDVEYIFSRDSTIMGSRSGLAPVYLWYRLSVKGREGVKEDVMKCLENARLLKSMLDEANIKAILLDYSITVLFQRPRDKEFIARWHIVCTKEYAHVVVMPNVTVDKLKKFVHELIQIMDHTVRETRNLPKTVVEEE